jgi:DNA-binding NarL/FixJ family response regulator
MNIIKVLIVDDSAAVRDALRSILTPHADFKIVGEAVDGLNAIEKASDLKPDIILMDTQMPGTDPVETTRRMKERFPEIKILLLAVHASYIREAIAAGADGYLMKDIERKKMLKTIRDLARGMS